MSETLSVQVRMVEKNGRTFVYIDLPSKQEPLSKRILAYMLTNGISLLIKSCDVKIDGISDSVLLNEVIKQLENEFVNVDSFNDVESFHKLKSK